MADLQKQAQKRREKRVTSGPSKGKVSKTAPVSKLEAKIAEGISTVSAKADSSRRSVATDREVRHSPAQAKEEEKEEDPSTQLVRQKRKWSKADSSHSEPRSCHSQSGDVPEASGA